MSESRKIGFWEAFSIGVGGMIGGGIFAVLGLSIQLSKSAAPLAFIIAGVIALTTAYSYVKLSIRFPSEGGTIEFLVRAYGTGILSGSLNVLLLLSYIVMIALYAYAFGSYGANILQIPAAKHILATAVVISFTLVNALGAFISGRTEDALVAFKLAILLAVAGAGLVFVNPSKLSPTNWADPISIVAGGMVIFLAYEGFELIANTAGDVKSPSVLPKAFYSSVALVIAVYVMIAVVTVGNLPYDVIIESRDYALAAAAKPSLGEVGFWLVTIAALASTSSAINATLYGTARASYMIAKYGQLPEAVERPIWRGAYEGLVVISILSIMLANTASLESISTAGSGGFLLVFLAVNLAAVKMRNKLKINAALPSAGVIMTTAALLILIYRMLQSNPTNLAIFATLIAASALTEIIYRSATGRKIEEYVDRNLKMKEEYLKNWEKWIGHAVNCILETFHDAEVYLVGSIARNEFYRSHDVDLLVITGSPPENREEAIEDIKRMAGLSKHHRLDVHFVHSSEREKALKRAGHYKVLKSA